MTEGKPIDFEIATTRKKFRAAHKQAQKTGAEAFSFEGNEVRTSYAGFLLQYLDMRFPLPKQ